MSRMPSTQLDGSISWMHCETPSTSHRICGALSKAISAPGIFSAKRKMERRRWISLLVPCNIGWFNCRNTSHTSLAQSKRNQVMRVVNTLSVTLKSALETQVQPWEEQRYDEVDHHLTTITSTTRDKDYSSHFCLMSKAESPDLIYCPDVLDYEEHTFLSFPCWERPCFEAT